MAYNGPIGPACKDCRFSEVHIHKGTIVRLCHRLPPLISAPHEWLESDQSVFPGRPEVADDDWCGEFEPDNPNPNP